MQLHHVHRARLVWEQATGRPAVRVRLHPDNARQLTRAYADLALVSPMATFDATVMEGVAWHEDETVPFGTIQFD